jgi:hypothetical protein
MRTKIDGPLVAYSLLGLAALIVSAPATYNLVAIYHSDGSSVGIAATVALLLILEGGAVASKLATLWASEARRWLVGFTLFALGVNTLSNLIHGGVVATDNGLPWLAAWGGALVYAAFLPALLYLMLHLICVRVTVLRGIERSTADEVALVLRPVAHAVAVAAEAQRTLGSLVPTLALPEPQATYARAQAVEQTEAAQPVATPITACDACGESATPMQLRTAAQHGGWRCRGCGKRVQA